MDIIFFLTCSVGALLSFNFFYPVILEFLRKKDVDGSPCAGSEPAEEADYAIIVTFFENIDLLPGIIKSIEQLKYKNFTVYVVADGCDISKLSCEHSNIVILRPPQLLKDNVKSHKYAIENFIRPHERITIIDGDNLIERNYLIELNKMFNRGYSAVQGAREAKNLNNGMSNLDAVGDLFYRYIDRKILFEAGSSAALSGSGMAFSSELYCTFIQNYNAQGAGFDKVLQYEIVKRKFRIGFSNEAIVYDQKTSNSGQLVKQRARWINTWFKSYSVALSLLIDSLRNVERNGLLFSLSLLRPPLFLLIGFSLLSIGINIYIAPFLNVLLAFGLLCFVYTFLKALRTLNAPKSMYKSLTTAPQFVFYQFIALLKSKRANLLSTATKHVLIDRLDSSNK